MRKRHLLPLVLALALALLGAACGDGEEEDDGTATEPAEEEDAALEENIEHVSAEYAALMADTVSRYQNDEPILYYTWTPNWTVAELVPGEDVVWIEAPDHPDGQEPVPGDSVPGGADACVNDPCDIGWQANDIRVVARSDLLDENPAAAALFEEVELTVDRISEQNKRMDEGEDSRQDIENHANEWIENNRDTVDEWLATARDAADGEISGDLAMGRANWDTGYFQAEIYYQLLQELGYSVEHPSNNESNAQVFYTALDEGELGFWVNGWFPLHDEFVEGKENIEQVGLQVDAGAFQGYLVDKATVEEHDIESIQQIAEDEELRSLFDFQGDERADLVGCNAGWGCHETINEHLSGGDEDS